jgi:hypothetical protein
MTSATKTTRHRGPRLDWKPQAKTQVLLNQIQGVLDEYRNLLPLTLRQVFYRLVGVQDYAKTENAYVRLGEVVGNARRAGIIPFESIRDDGVTTAHYGGYRNKGEFYADTVWRANSYARNRQNGQDGRIEVWCEAAGMVPQLGRVSGRYGISVYSSSGFDSITAKHDAGKRAAKAGLLTVLHIGDLDPSGEHVFSSAFEDVEAWATADGGRVDFVRVAVTRDQVEEHNLTTSPPKATDRRSFEGMTTQAEALDPAVLSQILDDAIEVRLDLDLYQSVVALERQERTELTREMLDSAIELEEDEEAIEELQTLKTLLLREDQ